MNQLPLKSIKTKITLSIIIISFFIVAIVGFIGVFVSSQIIEKEIREILLISSQNESRKIYKYFERVERAVDNYSNCITATVDVNSLKNAGYMKEYNKILAPVTREFAENTEWNMSSYFYFAPEATNGYYGAWYAFDKHQKKFLRITGDVFAVAEDFNPNNPSSIWYYNPINAKKALWTDLYFDPELKTPMITYSNPVYKRGILLGVSGMDISIDNLKKMVKGIKLYKYTDSFLVDAKFNFIASSKYNNKDNLAKVEKSAYKVLVKAAAKSENGLVDYKDHGVKRIATYTKLPNGYYLFITVPLSEALKDVSELRFLLFSIIVLTIIVADVVALFLGNVIANSINPEE